MTDILIVEDDRNIVSFVSGILLAAGFLCRSAGSAEQARQILESAPIALVILDHDLGEETESGLALLTWLRDSPQLKSLPVIICTGDTRPAVVSGFIGLRIAAYLRKPFRAERLLSEVQRVLSPTVSPPAAW